MKLEELQKLSDHFRHSSAPPDMALVHEYLRSIGRDPNNLYQELEMSGRFVQTHQDTSFSNAHLQLHSHAFYELLYCRNTCGAEYLVGADRYRLQQGDIIFVPPGVSHRPLLLDTMTQPYKRYVLWISPEFMEHFGRMLGAPASEPMPYSTLLRTAGTRWEMLGDYFRHGVTEEENRQPEWEAALIGNTVSLLTQLRRAVQERSASLMTAEKPALLEQLLAYIEMHLAEHITLIGTAQQFYISSSTVSQLFSGKMGVSFYRYVTQRRLIAAKSLIEQGHLLEHVATQVGFQDYSSFYRAFKQEYGISPRQYRTLHTSSGQ